MSEQQHLKHDDEAVLSHMSMYQEIITRLAGNSAAIKSWGLPLLTAALALVVTENKAALINLIGLAVVIFYLLDSYYLMLESRFRKGFKLDAEAISQDKFPRERLFQLRPEGSKTEAWKKALRSFSTWPLYLGILIMLIYTRTIVG